MDILTKQSCRQSRSPSQSDTGEDNRGESIVKKAKITTLLPIPCAKFTHDLTKTDLSNPNTAKASQDTSGRELVLEYFKKELQLAKDTNSQDYTRYLTSRELADGNFSDSSHQSENSQPDPSLSWGQSTVEGAGSLSQGTAYPLYKRFQCCICPYRSNFRRDIRKHEMTHTGVRPYQCSQCDFCATNRSNVKRHEMTHTGEKPYRCDQCAYQSLLKANVKRHQVKHTKEKPFKCLYCEYHSSFQRNVRKHEMIHTGERPFRCSMCPYRTIQKRDLLKHEATHTGDKPFKCSFCDYRAIQKGMISKHEKNHLPVRG